MIAALEFVTCDPAQVLMCCIPTYLQLLAFNSLLQEEFFLQGTIIAAAMPGILCYLLQRLQSSFWINIQCESQVSV